MSHVPSSDPEAARLDEDRTRQANWKRWGTYLSERQWGTVREDYSPSGDTWGSFPFAQARSRVYRWGEDGLLGFSDRESRLCFALALWNGRDPILKERLFGLTGPQGNHGEDVKEAYFYLDATPTHSYCKGLYKYPQAEFPYAVLEEENARRSREEPELELADTGVFDAGRYFDVQVEYAKAAPDDVLIRITATNRGPEEAVLHLLPTLWFRNTWSWGRTGEGYWPRPSLVGEGASIRADHASLGTLRFHAEAGAAVFTDNETNRARLWNAPNEHRYLKDAFHDLVIAKQQGAVNPARTGTKAAFLEERTLAPGEAVVLRYRLAPEGSVKSPFADFDAVFNTRIAEADAFYAARIPAGLSAEQRSISRQAYAGLLWSKQFFHYDVKAWLEGDPTQPPAAPERQEGRNHEWRHLYNRDVISMPDKWEYPWYAAWDLAFHMVPFARVDPDFAKEQLLLFLREWFMHPNGQLPAYEFNFSDVNPPVHAWAAWRVYKISAAKGERDHGFLARVLHKLLLNFTWWVNRKDAEGKNLFAGGFLGLDNIGVFDRSKPLPTGGHLEQADGTAWMAFYCATMMSISLELACTDPTYDDLASKFFEHFVGIVDAINSAGGAGLWDEEDGFYYDRLHLDEGGSVPLKVRSMVGLIPLFAVEVLEGDLLEKLPQFKKRTDWFLENRKDLAARVSLVERSPGAHGHALLAIVSKERLVRVLRYLLDEDEFLSPYGIRSLSKIHEQKPYVFQVGEDEHRVDYSPAESTTGLFGGNSNWRGPVWFPVNYLLIEALERYHHFYGDSLRVECPVGSGTLLTLGEVATELQRRLAALFTAGEGGGRPAHGGDARYAEDPHWKELVLFYEYFHGDTGRGVGASHQTGWTALVTRCLEELAEAAQAKP